MIEKKYNDSFEFCYNQKKNKKTKLILLKKIEKKYFITRKRQ